jgi:O-acetyl-ADP-ribose deacetylase (regulator of RNase III)
VIEYVVGDLLESGEQNIAHGCNCANVMGAGVAGAIARKWPHAREAYENRCRSVTFILGTAQPVAVSPTQMVWNLGTQQNPGKDGSLWGILLSFGSMLEQLKAWGQCDRVAIPRIGCGIAGLRWSEVERQIATAQHFVGERCPKVVVYTHPSEEGRNWG